MNLPKYGKLTVTIVYVTQLSYHNKSLNGTLALKSHPKNTTDILHSHNDTN